MTNANELERALLRAGDDLYRLALLLTPDEHQAARTLLAAVRQLAASGATPTEHGLFAALLNALPPDRHHRRLPGWTRPPAALAERQPLLQALARLPRQQRLALGLTILRAFEPAQAAPLLGGSELDARTLVRDALLALAPTATPALAPALLNADQAPEDCRPARAALALNDPALHRDAALRGHMALCSACRSAEHAWQQLTIQVEEALRGALRDVRLPPGLAAQLQAAAQPEELNAGRALLAHPSVRIALVALPVVALILFLIWPRAAAPTSDSQTAAAPLTRAPLDLVRSAQAQLYTPPPGQGTWHGRYELQWTFADNTAALLNGDLWIDPASGRHRAQLAHHSGGGPYEFELADGVANAWYAVSPNYAPSIDNLSYSADSNRVQLAASPQAQRQMLDARLASGAWGLAANYLQQAERAELRTWGRQRAADGALLDLISFSGISPLALPPDAPEATTSKITVLLAIDEASGRLREVRELLGAAGSEQTTRSAWRLVADERITDQSEASHIFDLSLAWNGAGDFAPPRALALAALPRVKPATLASLAIGFHLYWTGLWMPASPPPGTSAAALLSTNFAPTRPYEDTGEPLTFVYLGASRRLELTTNNSVRFAPLEGEVLKINGNPAIIAAANVQAYHAQITHPSTSGLPPMTTDVVARGYTRAELIALLQTLGPPTLEAYRSQAQLFADPRPFDRNTFDALLGALAPQPAGTTRHFVERIFKRHHDSIELPDPYHLPNYGGWPDSWLQDNWARTISSTLETSATTQGQDGTIYARQYRGPGSGWDYDARSSRVTQQPSSPLEITPLSNEDQGTIMLLLACAGAQLQTNADGTRSITLNEPHWPEDPCLHANYLQLLIAQSNSALRGISEQAPYLADQISQPLSTVVDLGADGRAARIQVWAGARDAGTLLESWERVSDELVPPERVPATIFDPHMPGALIQRIANDGQAVNPAILTHSVTLSEALQLVQTPLLLPPTTFAPTQTLVLTRSDSLTETLIVGPTLLSSIHAGNTQSGPLPQLVDQNTIFDAALIDGAALRCTYSITYDRGAMSLQLYQGPADRFGAYLRASARWSSSAATSVQIGKRQLPGWQVKDFNGTDWLIFEADGTLIALESPSPELRALIAGMELRRSGG